MDVPVLETEHLFLKGFEEGNLDHLAEITSDPEVVKYFPGVKPWPKEKTERELRKILNHWIQWGFGMWALVSKEDCKLIGWCGFEFLKELLETEIGFLIDKAYWNKGYATEAVSLSLEYAFNKFGLKKVIALSFPENTASRRVIEKSGMNYQKTIYLWKHQLVKYIITRNNFKERTHSQSRSINIIDC
jgi:ribosomal-protein-alanine N-acetyltransferase